MLIDEDVCETIEVNKRELAYEDVALGKMNEYSKIWVSKRFYNATRSRAHGCLF